MKTAKAAMEPRATSRTRLPNIQIQHNTVAYNPRAFTHLEFLASEQVGQVTDRPKRNVPRSRVPRCDTPSG